MMGQPPNLMGNQAPFTVNSSNVMPQHQHYQPGPNGNYSLIPQHATGAYNQPPMQNMGMQRQPNMQTQGGGGGKFNFPCDNCDGYGRGTNYCPFPQDDLKIANKKAARIARNAEADDRQRRVNQILMDRGFHNAVSILPSERRAPRYNQNNVTNPGFSQGMMPMQGMQMGPPGAQFGQPWGSMSMSMTPPRCVIAPATVPVTVTTPDGRQMVVQMPADRISPTGGQSATPSPTTSTGNSPGVPMGEPQTPQHQLIQGTGMPQPKFSPAAIQPWEVRWGKLNSKPDMPTYTSRLQALRGLKEIECPEPFEGLLVLLFDNQADANVAALLLKEFILRSDDGSTLPSTVEGPRLRAPPAAANYPADTPS